MSEIDDFKQTVRTYVKNQRDLINLIKSTWGVDAQQELRSVARSGSLNLNGKIWQFHCHGTGVEFISSDDLVIDAHDRFDLPNAIDAWRLHLYLDSRAHNKLRLGERTIKEILNQLDAEGFLSRIDEYHYILSDVEL